MVQQLREKETMIGQQKIAEDFHQNLYMCELSMKHPLLKWLQFT